MNAVCILSILLIRILINYDVTPYSNTPMHLEQTIHGVLSLITCARWAALTSSELLPKIVTIGEDWATRSK